MEFWEASRLVVEAHSGPNVSNSCARKSKQATLRVFAVPCGASKTVANAAAAPFVGKNSRSKVHCGALLCDAGHWRESAPEKPLIGVVPFPGAN
jgi:altronate dehydratase